MLRVREAIAAMLFRRLARTALEQQRAHEAYEDARDAAIARERLRRIDAGDDPVFAAGLAFVVEQQHELSELGRARRLFWPRA